MRFATLTALIGLYATTFVSADGCANCGDMNRADVESSCVTQCQDALDPSSAEYARCSDECSKFVYDQGCCSTTVCTPSGTAKKLRSRDASPLTLEEIKENPSLINMFSLAAREPPFDQITSNEELQALADELSDFTFETDISVEALDDGGISLKGSVQLEERDYGSCCASCRRIFGQLGNWCPSSIGALGAQAALFACLSSCSRTYQTICRR